MQSHYKKRVSYYYDSDIGNYFYGPGHPMKPLRLWMTHDLILNYGLYSKMEIYRPHKATLEDMCKFHSDDYVHFLRSICPDNITEYREQLQRFNMGSDCPIFDGLYNFCQISAGGTVDAAIKLNKRASEICINWSGGLHHAKKSQASGFCYINDIVLGILELLKCHQRVLYIDIDVHHGDGVQEAFYTTDRVMTVSFHKHGNFFPGTGYLTELGAEKGENYALNIPLQGGIDDASYENIFVPIISKVMETYQPAAVVLQCGADSLTGDRLGCFNLTLKGHGKCVEFVKKFNLPLLMVGGGGYTLKNVARCWTYETSLALDEDIANELPQNDYIDYLGHNLHIGPNEMINWNTPEHLTTIMNIHFENLRQLPHAPGVQIHAIPENAVNDESDEEDKMDKDVRLPQSDTDKRIVPENEFSDSEDEDEGGRRDNYSNINQRKRPTLDKDNVIANLRLMCAENFNLERDENGEDEQPALGDSSVNLGMQPYAPGDQIQAIPEDDANDETDEENKLDKDVRVPQSDIDERIVPENEFSDSEDEDEGGQRDNYSNINQRKRLSLDKDNVIANLSLMCAENFNLERDENGEDEQPALGDSSVNLGMQPYAPGDQIQAIPEDDANDESDEAIKLEKDVRLPQSDIDERIVPENEFSDSEDEDEGGRRDNYSNINQRKRLSLDKDNVIANLRLMCAENFNLERDENGEDEQPALGDSSVNLGMQPYAPGDQIQAIPEDDANDESDEANKLEKDVRLTQSDIDERIVPENEFSDSEDEDEGGRRDNYSNMKQCKLPCLDKDNVIANLSLTCSENLNLERDENREDEQPALGDSSVNLGMQPYAPDVQVQAIPEDAANDESNEEEKMDIDDRGGGTREQ